MGSIGDKCYITCSTCCCLVFIIKVRYIMHTPLSQPNHHFSNLAKTNDGRIPSLYSIGRVNS